MVGYGSSGITHDFFCYDVDGNVWNGAAFGSWSDGSYTTYRVTATEVGTSGRFLGTEPSGTVTYELRERAATLALSYIVWTGDTSSDGVSLNADVTAIKAKTDLIGTYAATVPVRSSGTTYQMYVGETSNITITTSTDYSAETLTIEVDDRDGTSVATIADGSITKTSTTISFAATAAMTSKARILLYAVRKASNSEVLLHGKIVVDYMPLGS